MKAIAAVSFFSLAGIVGFLLSDEPSTPLLLYYVALVINSYFSVATFAPMTPTSIPQALIDTALTVLYGALALSFESVGNFTLISAALFLLATLKYVHLRTVVSSPYLIPRKIRIDLLGAGLSLATFVLVRAGYPDLAAWTLAALFIGANVYLLFVSPMYRSTP
ncbi:MAG: hypothetical protein HYS26_00225 [Candidatus Kaiserbacteria bacterium]|nr:MAG: hypothetical protein HYS26_00225 [Candidatus Kaiserbacteria bacterium]